MFQDIPECEKELSYMREHLLIKHKQREKEKAFVKFYDQYQTDIEALYEVFFNILTSKRYKNIPPCHHFAYIVFQIWNFKGT